MTSNSTSTLPSVPGSSPPASPPASASDTHAATSERVRELLSPVLAEAGYELIDAVLHAGTLQVLVELEIGRIDLDGVAAATRLVDEVLESTDPIPGSYMLEVSSPGLERPLRTPAHFQRFVGSQITLKTNPGVDGDRRIEGILATADAHFGGDVVVGERRVAYVDIERARTVFVFGGQPKPGGPKPGGPKSKKSAQATTKTAPPMVLDEGEQR
jgi:ribosome maturation factor RimP